MGNNGIYTKMNIVMGGISEIYQMLKGQEHQEFGSSLVIIDYLTISSVSDNIVLQESILILFFPIHYSRKASVDISSQAQKDV